MAREIELPTNVPKSKDVCSKPTNNDYVTPKLGEPHVTYSTDLNVELLERGGRDFIKYLESVKGQLTQAQYELIKTDTLTLETLLAVTDGLMPSNAEAKYLFLKRRYYVDSDQIVRDHKRDDTIVCEPELMYELIVSGHLLNNHLHWRKLHRFLKSQYSNITRDFVQMCARYCSECNPQEEVKPFTKFKHTNAYQGLLPLERIHVEIFKPFGTDELIEEKYSHVLYCRDYHSRFVWLSPLTGITFRELVPQLTEFLLSLPRLPIFLETTTLDRQDMFDMCEYIARKYQLAIGLGLNNSSNFYKNGIERMKYLLQTNKKKCAKDWGMCLKYGSYHNNTAYNPRIMGFSNDLLCNEVSSCGKKFKLKREKIIHELFAHNVVTLKDTGGMVYVENENSVFVMEDDDLISVNQDSQESGTPMATSGDQDVEQEMDETPSMGLTPLKGSNGDTLHKTADSTPKVKRTSSASRASSKRTGERASLSDTITPTKKVKKVGENRSRLSGSESVEQGNSEANRDEYDLSEEIPGPSTSFFATVNHSRTARADENDISIEL